MCLAPYFLLPQMVFDLSLHSSINKMFKKASERHMDSRAATFQPKTHTLNPKPNVLSILKPYCNTSVTNHCSVCNIPRGCDPGWHLRGSGEPQCEDRKHQARWRRVVITHHFLSTFSQGRLERLSEPHEKYAHPQRKYSLNPTRYTKYSYVTVSLCVAVRNIPFISC